MSFLISDGSIELKYHSAQGLFNCFSSLRSEWNSAWDQKQNLILLPWCSVSLQHISSIVMWEPSRNSSIGRQLLDLSTGEAVGKWEFEVNPFALYTTFASWNSTQLQNTPYSRNSVVCIKLRSWKNV